MVTLINNGDSSTKFVFENSKNYLFGDGEIVVPINSLSLVIDRSEMVTFKKASCGDPFISFRADDSNLGTKEAIEAFYKEYMVGETGGGGITPEEVDAMIESALTDVYVDIADIQDEIDTKEEVIATALNELNEASEETVSAITELNEAMDTMVAALNQVHGEINVVYTELNDKITENSDSITNLNSELDSVEGDVAALSDDITALSGDVADVQANITDVQADIADVQADIADVQADMGGLKLVKIYESDYEALSEKDGNTLYVVVPDIPFDEQYLTIKSLSDNNEIKLTAGVRAEKTVSASTDGGTTWNAYTSSSDGVVLATLNNGDTLLLKGENSGYVEIIGGAFLRVNKFVSTGQFDVYGNIMSLTNGDNFKNATTLTTENTFAYMFENSNVVSAENLVMPATTLTKSCYSYMFQGCTSLTTAPELPATTLAQFCYTYMFFNDTSLNYIKMLATDISASSCLNSWVSGVSSTGTFVKNASMTSLPTGINGIPSNWTVQDA